MDCSPPGSSVHGILEAWILKWVAIPFSRGSSWPRDWIWFSCIVGGFFTTWATRGAKSEANRISFPSTVTPKYKTTSVELELGDLEGHWGRFRLAAEIVGGKLMGWEPVHIGPLWGSLAVLCRLTAASPFTKHGAHACPGWQAPLWRASVPLLPDSPPNQPQDRTLALWRPCS